MGILTSRYGTVMAIGIGCCGTALPAAIDILKPLLKDPVDIVRQATYLAMAMVSGDVIGF